MAEEIVFKARVETGNSANDINKNINDPLQKAGKNVQKTFDNLRGEIKETQEALDKSSKSTKSNAKEVENLEKKLSGLTSEYMELSEVATDVNATFEDMHGELQPLTTQISEAEDRMHKLTLEGQTQSQEFQELQQKVVTYKQAIIETDRAVDALVEQGRGLGTALQLGSTVVSGYGALEGTMAILGTESEALQQTFVKLQAVQTILMSLEELKIALDRQSLLMTKARSVATGVMTVAQQAYTWATTATTTAMKLLRIAMLAIPLVAVLAGIIALVSAITSFWKETEKAKDMQDQLGAIIEENEKRIKSASEAYMRDVDNRIKIAQAEGASAQELHDLEIERIKRMEAVRRKDKDVQTAKIKDLQALLKQAEKENNEEIIESTKTQIQTAQDKYDELKALDDQYHVDLKASNAQFLREQQEADDADRKERADKWKAWKEQQEAEAEEQAQKELRLNRMIRDFMIESIDDESTKRQLKLQERHKREREDLIKEFGEDAKLLEALRRKQAEESTALTNQLAEQERANLERLDQQQAQKDKEALDRENANAKAELEGKLIQMREDFEATQEVKAELAELERDIALQDENLTAGEKFKIQEEYNEKLVNLAQETADREKAIKEEAMATGFDIAQQGATAVQGLSDAVFSIQQSNLKEGDQAHLASQKKQFNVNKGVQIGMSTISGIQGVINALTAQSVIPEPFGTILKAVNAVAVGASTVANIAKIKKQQFQGGGGGGAGTTGSVGVGAPSVPDISGGGDTTLTEDLLDQAGVDADGGGGSLPSPGGGDKKVKIVDSDLKIALDDKAEVDDTSTMSD